MRLLLVFLLWMPVGLFGVPLAFASEIEEPPLRLALGVELAFPLVPGSTPLHVEVELGEHDLVFVQVEQQGLDVAVTTPAGICQDQSWTADLRRGTSGIETIPLASSAEGQPIKIIIQPVAETVAETVADSTPPESRVVVRIANGETVDQAAEHCLGWRAFLEARMDAARGLEGQPEAIESYRRSVEIFRRLDNDPAIRQVLFNQAVSEHWLGRLDEALDHLSEVRRRLAGDASARGDLHDALAETAIIFQRLGRDELAKALFDDALTVAEELGDGRRLSTALNGIGLVLKRLDRWPEALDYYLRALDLATGEPCLEAAVRVNLGRIYDKLGEFQSALEHSSQAVELARGTESGSRPCRQLSAARNSLGLVYLSLGRWRAGAAAFEAALEDADAAGRPRILVNLGRTLARNGEAERARSAYLEAAHLGEQLGDEITQFSAWSNLGFLVLHEFQQADLARQHFQTASRFVGAEGGLDASYLLMLQAELDLWLGDADAAAEKATTAVKLARSLGSPSQEGIAVYYLAKSRLRQGRVEEAVELAAEATHTVEGLRRNAAGHEFRASFLARREHYFELWITALLEQHRRTSDPKWLDQSLEVAERSRARALLDMFDSADIERSDVVDPELARLERELESLYIRRQHLNGEGSPSDDRRQQIERALSTVQARILERRSHLRASHPNWSALRSPETLDAAEIRRHTVDDDTVLLHSFVGEEAAWLWLVQGDEIRTVAIPPRAELEARIRGLLGALTAPAQAIAGEDLLARRRRLAEASRTFDELSEDLSESLFGTLLAGSTASRIVVVPSGPLAYLPFSALPDPRTEPRRPFVFEVEWVQLPSASVLGTLRRQAPEEAGDQASLAVLADPVFSGSDARLHGDSTGGVATARSALDERDFQRLPGTAEEARQLADMVPGPSLVATGFEATAGLVRSGALEPYRILHFATHGVVETEYPELSALVFSRLDAEGEPLDGFLRLPEIYRLRLTADLVVLSACETALGQDIRGEGLIGLTRGFLYAGASSVVASLWAVQDQATRELMAHTYRHHLEAGLPIAAALHKAQREMAAKGFAPYYWAGFVLQGDWH